MNKMRPLTSLTKHILGTALTVCWSLGQIASGHSDVATQLLYHGQQQCSVVDMAKNGSCESGGEVFIYRGSQQPWISSRPEEDPMLAKMPGLDFSAYRRRDTSAMYSEAPGSRQEKIPSFKGQAGKFVSMSPERLDLYWDSSDGSIGHFMSATGPFESSGTCTFVSHVFHFVVPNTDEIVCTFTIKPKESVYYCDPFVANDPSDPSAGVHTRALRSQKEFRGDQLQLYSAAVFNRNFAPLYKNFTGGSEWLGNFPTKPPAHPMWRADYISQEHQVTSHETHFLQQPPPELLHRLSEHDLRRNESDTPALLAYRDSGMLNLTLKAVSVEPRISQIEGFLSDVEVEHILDLSTKKVMKRSMTGEHGTSTVLEVRTSQNTWLPRHTSPIMDAIIRRAANVLQIDEMMFRHRRLHEGNLSSYSDLRRGRGPINEDLQIVHYDVGQEYTAHHDFGYPDSRPNAPS